MFLIVWLIFFALMFVFFYSYDYVGQSKYQINPGMVTITPDKQGHYYLDGTINDYPVKFMLDTGATLVAIPESLAKKMKLQGRYSVTIQTAGGDITGSLTRINTLSFADFVLKDVKAVIIPGDDDLVLLGMNVLGKFDLSQKGKRLILRKD
ncbi:Aspartyl protease [Legionella hackeliae]|uniref:Aspartyl protease n=2 Tax=Legionella hackeliae TaxID=449 RepID=A0A0A8USN6_LEGHA|nr:aspartyl protease [Legionella hackeliae]CEK09789.1 aspartyl protease [Legionella hackeliae]STX49699.1 Aspartyl protease [Legionella hackeliae]